MESPAATGGLTHNKQLQQRVRGAADASHVRRASHASAPPLNCGVSRMRVIAWISIALISVAAGFLVLLMPIREWLRRASSELVPTANKQLQWTVTRRRRTRDHVAAQLRR
jgi:hypothetical protein